MVANPQDSFLGMPSAPLVTVILVLVSLAAAPWSSSTFLMLAMAVLGLPVLILVLGIACDRDHSARLALAQGQYLAAEFGRIWICLRLGRPILSLRRSRDYAARIDQDWPRLTATSWAIWITLIIEILLLWTGARPA